ncbi:hypothetical protein BJX68DRAFT_244007 [Aspergillus pseudodeflectus]|uniref:C2H2-type domain-containing protein n=1 Tax=Aspergillus pseudodeflectus TaxID=176178 RepID=A0ABR4JTT0_9EURO
MVACPVALFFRSSLSFPAIMKSSLYLQAPSDAMQQPISTSQSVLNHTEDQRNSHPYISPASLHPTANSQLLALSVVQELPLLSNQDTELLPDFRLVPGDRPDPAAWSSMRAVEWNDSTTLLAQPLVNEPWMSTRPPDSSTDRRDQIPANGASGYHFADPPELSLQERGERISHWTPNSPPAGQSLVYPSIEDPSYFERTLRCEWAGCRSVTVFRRESDLMRHIKTIHVSPKAHRCTQLNCAMAFGRKDHLKAHQKTHHGW